MQGSVAGMSCLIQVEPPSEVRNTAEVRPACRFLEPARGDDVTRARTDASHVQEPQATERESPPQVTGLTGHARRTGEVGPYPRY